MKRTNEIAIRDTKTLLRMINLIRKSAEPILSKREDRYEEEERYFFFCLNEAAVTFAHLRAPGKPSRSNALLRESGLEDLQE